MNESNTQYKRLKRLKLDKFYVAPEVKALGTRFESRRSNAKQIALPIRLQCVFPYIPILKTIRCLANNEKWLQTYLDYNKSGGNGHKCKDGEFVDFCCGEIFKNCELFQNYPNSLQIQIYTDDFEICNPIGSKSTIHKVCGVYFVVRNMPDNSKLSNIHLIALCNTDDLNTESTDFNNIWFNIVKEIKELEKSGVQINDQLNLRGTVTILSGDNLGLNTATGMVQSFNATYYCRICKLQKGLCQTECEERPLEVRTISDYNQVLKTIENSTSVDFNESRGVKRECELNKLKYFHTIQNVAADIMHDVNEGAIPFVLKLLFEYCIQERIISEKDLEHKCQYYDYGLLNRSNIPSKIDINKHNLGQNASQNMCLFQNIGFILFDYINIIGEKWKCITSLQNVIRIIFSVKTTDEDLKMLKFFINQHLESLKLHFSVKLLPKHHFMTHYVRIIRLMGSLLNLNSIRFEAKHQVLKRYSKTKNFKNVNISIARKHQQNMAESMKAYSNENKIEISRKSSLCENESIREIQFFQFNDRRFRSGFLILNDGCLHEISKILAIDGKINLVCKALSFCNVEKELSSVKIEISRPEIETSIEYNSHIHTNIYEKKKCNGNQYVYIENLEIERVISEQLSDLSD